MGRPKKEAPNHGKYYEVKVTVGRHIDGKPDRRSFYSEVSKDDAKEQARLYRQRQEEAHLAGTVLVEKSKNFSLWADSFLEHYVKGFVKDNTYWNNYAAPIENHLKPYFGKVDITDIKPLDIKDFFVIKRKEGLALGTLEKLRVCLHSLFEAAMENDLCYKNPVTSKTKVASDKASAVKRTYTKEQRDAIITVARGHVNGLGIILMFENGLTRSELLGLTWDMIDFDACSLTIEQGLVAVKDIDTKKRRIVEGAPKNDYRRRTVPLESKTVEMLRERYKNRAIIVGENKAKGKSGIIVLPRLIFCNAKGEAFDPDNWSDRVYKSFMQEAVTKLQGDYPGIQCLTAHELRHTFATLAQEETDDMLALMRAMGHADLKMLQSRYAHISLEQMRKALNREEIKSG